MTAQLGNIHGFVAVNTGNGNAAGNPTNMNGANTNARTGFDDDDMDTIDSMRTRLTAISATAYSPAMLDKMTYNDMVYALRVHDSPSSIKQ